jgi:transposase-like protein
MEKTHIRRTREEMFPIVESWQQSGLSKKAFCEAQGIIKSVFFYWCKKYREEHRPGGFVALTTGGVHALAQGQSMEIQYPNGVVLRLPTSTPAGLVLQYVGQ